MGGNNHIQNIHTKKRTRSKSPKMDFSHDTEYSKQNITC